MVVPNQSSPIQNNGPAASDTLKLGCCLGGVAIPGGTTVTNRDLRPPSPSFSWSCQLGG